VAVGGTPAGAAIITSQSITIIISTEIRTSTAAIGTTSTAATATTLTAVTAVAVATAAGATTLSTVAAHLIQTNQRQTNLAVQLAETPLATVKQMRASNNRAIVRPAARAIEEEGQIALGLQIAAATARAQVAWTQTGAVAGAEQAEAVGVIASEIEVYLPVRVVAGGAVAVPLVAPPVVRVTPVPAVHGAPQAWEVPVVAVEVPVVAAGGDGGN
jgi:hypothetical protein